jgi:DNA-binding NtrC family response regulator
MNNNKILVVDDEDDLRQIIIDILKVHEYDAIGAASGNMAIKLLKDMDFDLVVSDVRMKDGDGIKLLK